MTNPYQLKSTGNRPEDAIVQKLRLVMIQRGWYTYKTHGSELQAGLPDLFCWHKNFGLRMIEVKTETGTYTPAQREIFHLISAHGGMIWTFKCSSPPDEAQLIGKLDLLKGPPNWHVYL